MRLITGGSGFIGPHLIEEMKLHGLPASGVLQVATLDLVAVPSYGPEMDWTDCFRTSTQ